VFVDLNHVPSWVSAAREALEAFRLPEDDRVGLGAGLDRVALFDEAASANPDSRGRNGAPAEQNPGYVRALPSARS
jgi:hypothetical protein